MGDRLAVPKTAWSRFSRKLRRGEAQGCAEYISRCCVVNLDNRHTITCDFRLAAENLASQFCSPRFIQRLLTDNPLHQGTEARLQVGQ
jgi:hypothetical protein